MSLVRNLSIRRVARGASTLVFVFTAALILNLCSTSGFFRDFYLPLRSDSRFQMSKDGVEQDFEGNLRLARKNMPSVKGSFNFSDNDKEEKSSFAVEEENNKAKLVVEKVVKKGRNQFFIKGLPTNKIPEVKNFFAVTTPTTKQKKELGNTIEKMYGRRKQRLIESCEEPKKHKWHYSMQLIAVPDKDFTVCVVQKAGSSSWHRLIYGLRVPNGTWTGDGHMINRKHGMELPKEIKRKLMKSEGGTRVLTVRHPFARLISGWNNKFHKNHLRFSTRILETLPGIEDYFGLHKPDDDHVIAFEDFVQYLADRGTKELDAHFKTIEELCRPCEFPYDYIAKAETSRQDLWWVLDKVGATMGSFVKHTATGSGENGAERKDVDPWKAERKIMSAFFHKVPSETIDKLLEMYKVDFIRFGYTFDKSTLMAGEIID